jgi:two-component system response regulator
MEEAVKEMSICGHLHVVRNGEQALAFLRHEEPYHDSPRPAFILLDLHLPRKSGPEVLAEVKGAEDLRRIPVFILSTSTCAEDVSKAYDLHANCYIPKPVDLDNLVQVSKRIEAFWLCTAVLPG